MFDDSYVQNTAVIVTMLEDPKEMNGEDVLSVRLTYPTLTSELLSYQGDTNLSHTFTKFR